MKKLLLFAFAMFAFVACSDDDNTPIVEVVTFEDAKLGEAGFIWGKEQAKLDENEFNVYNGPVYTEADATFITDYNDWGGSYESWSGFVVSNHTDMKTPGFKNDKSIYGKSGANGSKTFAMAFDGFDPAFMPYEKLTPTIKFNKPVQMKSVFVGMPTYLYLYFKGVEGDSANAAHPLVDASVEITGYLKGTPTGVAELSLIDGTHMLEGWFNYSGEVMKVLNVVDELRFKFVCSDTMAPKYFAIDNLTYVPVLNQ